MLHCVNDVAGCKSVSMLQLALRACINSETNQNSTLTCNVHSDNWGVECAHLKGTTFSGVIDQFRQLSLFMQPMSDTGLRRN